MNDGDWIKKQLEEVKAKYPHVTEAVLVRVEELLTGPLSEGALSKGQLGTLAKDLLQKMAPEPPKAEDER